MLNLDIKKYGKDAPFADPVVKCDSCQKLLYREDIQKNGCCICGSRRVRNVHSLTETEMAQMKEKNIDPAFISLFEEVADD